MSYRIVDSFRAGSGWNYSPSWSCCEISASSWFYSALLTQYCAGGKIEKNEMGGVCGAYGGGERCARGSGRET